jgi:hypothetical protein
VGELCALDSRTGATLIHAFAATPHSVALLLLLREAARLGLDAEELAIDRRDLAAATPLHYACRALELDQVRLLLVNGASPHLQDNSGNTPLHCVLSLHLRAEQRLRRIDRSLRHQDGPDQVKKLKQSLRLSRSIAFELLKRLCDPAKALALKNNRGRRCRSYRLWIADNALVQTLIAAATSPDRY